LLNKYFWSYIIILAFTFLLVGYRIYTSITGDKIGDAYFSIVMFLAIVFGVLMLINSENKESPIHINLLKLALLILPGLIELGKISIFNTAIVLLFLCLGFTCFRIFSYSKTSIKFIILECSMFFFQCLFFIVISKGLSNLIFTLLKPGSDVMDAISSFMAVIPDIIGTLVIMSPLFFLASIAIILIKWVGNQNTTIEVLDR